MFLFAYMALITAIPLIPVLESCLILSLSMPPIATTGMLTALQISFNVFHFCFNFLFFIFFGSCFDVFVNIDPTPK